MIPSQPVEYAAVSLSSENVLSLLNDAFFGGEGIDRALPIHAAFLHHFQSPGGAVRVALTQKCSLFLGIPSKQADCLAAAIECLHNASLVQDDLQDHSKTRRDQRAVVDLFGPDVALGLTDRLITAAFVCLAEVKPSSAIPSLLRRLHHAVAETVNGQTTELSGGAGMARFEQRLEAASKKSGPLFALALELPLILARHPDSLDAAHRSACLFGLGYQLLDDLADQAEDAANPKNSNLVLAMVPNFDGKSAQVRAIDLARQFLDEAISLAETLPNQAGTPLIELAKCLFPKLDAYQS